MYNSNLKSSKISAPPKNMSKKQREQEEIQYILTKLIQIPENSVCCDCNKRGARWASWNIGIFLCIQCAGIHRNLGAHISKVKSVNLDIWTEEQVSVVQHIGNKISNQAYEKNLKPNVRRRSRMSMANYIREKYVNKSWLDPTYCVPKNLKLGKVSKKNITTNSLIKIDMTKFTDANSSKGLLSTSNTANDLLTLGTKKDNTDLLSLSVSNEPTDIFQTKTDDKSSNLLLNKKSAQSDDIFSLHVKADSTNASIFTLFSNSDTIQPIKPDNTNKPNSSFMQNTPQKFGNSNPLDFFD
ncbi:ADP-ribosylation factor GTPase-activating protein effector protein 2 [Intoshia linei]|uniref:ADP-ribosylation factor GTPase-activating protein effector protein 2 n=1 Tax=Intoshia linei TaxID=1819745 RepID=A0A177B6S9_9BILA|nr:ADP-ribosylation factor GTPase-activating protein effector protein 2 [Intoshia linei]